MAGASLSMFSFPTMWPAAPVAIHPGDRVRAVDGPAGVVVQTGSLTEGFVIRTPGGELRDAPAAAVISTHQGVVWLSVSAGLLARHPRSAAEPPSHRS